MGVNVKAVLGSVAVCGVLLLAGCGSGTASSEQTMATSAEAVWNPPRPTGVADEKWATVIDGDPASLPVEELAAGYCQAVKPEPAEVDAKALEYPGASAEEFNMYYNYVLAYGAPLCAVLPPAMQVKGIHKVGARQSSDL
jgi:hypothetical protein